jgi:hypothetical protein
MDLGAHGCERLRSGVGAGEAQYFMADVMNSRTMAEPTNPVAPVTKMRM